jgi:hypothetical protein
MTQTDWQAEACKACGTGSNYNNMPIAREQGARSSRVVQPTHERPAFTDMILRLHKNLTKAESSLLIQIRTGPSRQPTVALACNMSVPFSPPWRALCRSLLDRIPAVFHGLGPCGLGHQITRCSTVSFPVPRCNMELLSPGSQL